jgi:hypothetical protein
VADAIQSDFQAYLQHLVRNIHYECPKCKTKTCLACGDKVDIAKRPGPSDAFTAHTYGKSKNEGTHGKEPTEEIPALLHCSDLQVSSAGDARGCHEAET